jgi:uncharacterized protein (DUF2132 family)
MTIDFEIIEKEKIETLKFPHSEVLEDDSAIKERTNALKSTFFWEFRTFKIQIYFEEVVKKMVETTVWAVTDESVVLKKGVESQLIEF